MLVRQMGADRTWKLKELRRSETEALNQKSWEPARPLQGSLPPGPKCRKSLENVSWGLRPGTPKKSPQSLGDSLGSLRRVSGKCLESLFGFFPDFLETLSGSQA